jgi:hypothetical protein
VGIQRNIHHYPGATVDWAAIRDRLGSLGESVTILMIDGQPAYPDELPEQGWRELRLGLSGGMVTLRREPTSLSCVVWGNANPDHIMSRERLCWACAAATGGAVEVDDGTTASADHFAADFLGR